MMRWFDSNFDYVQEFIENWNKKVKKIRLICFIIAILMIVAGILCIAYPRGTFALLHFAIAGGMIILGVYHIISYVSSTYYFKDPMLIVMGIVNILLGILFFNMPVMVTAEALTFILAIVLLFSGAERISFASKLKYFQIADTKMITWSGILNIVVALIFLFLPFVSALVLNTIIGVYLVIGGIALIIEAIAMKNLHRN